ncbi:uncharacterized protein LOC127266280 [Andrographis paniculata]|uniref:uncharacterized protein LOC127266280 n=1 Tax=Andrographis paniculata TaxID=175694 RepID=UPI0021E7DE87|nr:uncharacterized protein LOC127266280 [Andrographis paniculata]
MAMAISASRSRNCSHFIGRSYEIALKKSIDDVLTSLRCSGSSNLGDFGPEFGEYVQSKADPPMESIWIYAALSAASCRAPETNSFGRISAVKGLFQLIVSCSASCNSMKSIALAAPVVFYLHGLMLDLKGFELSSKREEARREIKALIDSALSYVSICCNGFDGNYDNLENLLLPLEDLAKFWVSDNGAITVESMSAFFPLLSENIVERSVEECNMIDLAGFVIAEAFLLKLCWKIQEEGFGKSIMTELRDWAVGSITGLRSPCFFAALVSLLLEPTLPTTSLLNPERESGLRKILFDAVILVEYSFLSSESMSQLPKKLAKKVIFTKLMATHKAIELFREHDDHAKAVLYSNAFASSTLPRLLIKYVKSETGTELSTNEPAGSSPRAFIRWMLNIENKGIRIFDDDMARLKATFNSMEEIERIVGGEAMLGQDSETLFFIDNKGQEEYITDDDDDEKTNSGMSAAFISASRSLQPSEQKGKKRKTKDGKETKRLKFIKYKASDLSSLPREKSMEPRSENSDSGSDLETPSSDKV